MTILSGIGSQVECITGQGPIQGGEMIQNNECPQCQTKLCSQYQWGQYGYRTYFYCPKCDSCDCGENPVPCLVFDPFLGSGTVGVVAQKYNRKWVGCELKWDYCKMAKKRCRDTDVAMI